MALVAIAARAPLPNGSVAARVPCWAWTGGMFGAVFIGLSIVLIPRLGSATFVALLIAGQMVTAIAFDHFGVLELAQRSIDLPRIAGAALRVSGVLLIQR